MDANERTELRRLQTDLDDMEKDVGLRIEAIRRKIAIITGDLKPGPRVEKIDSPTGRKSKCGRLTRKMSIV